MNVDFFPRPSSPLPALSEARPLAISLLLLFLCAAGVLAQTTVPPPPGPLTATGGQSGGNRTVVVNWSVNGNTPASAYSFQYNIYRGTAPGGEAARRSPRSPPATPTSPTPA